MEKREQTGLTFGRKDGRQEHQLEQRPCGRQCNRAGQLEQRVWTGEHQREKQRYKVYGHTQTGFCPRRDGMPQVSCKQETGRIWFTSWQGDSCLFFWECYIVTGSRAKAGGHLGGSSRLEPMAKGWSWWKQWNENRWEPTLKWKLLLKCTMVLKYCGRNYVTKSRGQLAQDMATGWMWGQSLWRS